MTAPHIPQQNVGEERDHLRRRVAELEAAEDGRKRSEVRLARIGECFLSLTTDALENINRFTALCGELLGGACALYNRIIEGRLCSWGVWNPPAAHDPVVDPDGHVCTDVIHQGAESVVVIRDLHLSRYAQTDPNVLAHGLKTYVGRSVTFGDSCVGSLCVLFREDFVPTAEDRRLVEIIAAAIAAEEKRKEDQDALRRNERMLSRVLSSSPLGISYVEESRLKLVNQAMCRMFGYESQAECLGRSPSEFYASEEEYRRVRDILYESLSKTQSVEMEALLKRKDGSTFYGSLKMAALDPSAPRAGTIATCWDISGKKQAEEALRESEERHRALYRRAQRAEELYSSLLHSCPDPVVIYDMEGRATFISSSFTTVFGWTPEEILGKRLPYVPESHMAQTMQAIRGILRNGKSVSDFETRRCTKDGRILDISLSSARFNDHEGDPAGLLVILRDISERKKSEQVLREAHADLERRVEERTASLRESNEKLRAEIIMRHTVESELAKSERRYRTLVETARELVWLVDLNLKFTYVSPSVKPLLGYEADEYVRMDALATVAPPYREELVHTFQEEVAREEDPSAPRDRSRTKEYEIFRKDGSLCWVESTMTFLRDGEGMPIEVYGVSRDITDRKRAEEALLAEKSKFQTLTDNAPFAMAMISEEGVIEYINPRFTELFGYDLREVPNGRTWFRKAFPDPDYRHMVVSTWINLLSRSKPGELRARVLNVVCKDGSRKIIHFRPVQLPTGEHLVTYEDVTERIQSAEAVRKSEEKYRLLYEESQRAAEIYRSLLNSLADAVVIYDMHGRCRYLTESFTQMFGWTLEEVIDRSIPYLPDSEREASLELIRNVVQEGTPCSGFETKRCTKDGRLLDISVMASRYNDHEGRPAGMLVILSDISSRKAAERGLAESEERYRKLNEGLEGRVRERTAQLEAAIRELESFAYSVSHDLRAPLRSIDGFSQVLLEDYLDVLDDQGKDSLQRVRAASRRMAQLIDALLQLSRVTRREMHTRRVSLSALASSIGKELRDSEPDRQVEMIIEPGLMAIGDERLLRAALANLLGNAWKFTGQCERALIELGRMDPPQGSDVPQETRQVFFVRDNGAGFDMAYAGKLFGAFQRLHGTTEFPGTGIGLATVQRIVCRHGGRVWAEAAVDKGATFFFTLKETDAEPTGETP